MPTFRAMRLSAERRALCAWRISRASLIIVMGKRRADADFRRFFDEFQFVRVSRFRATGVIDPAKPYALIPFPNGKTKVIYAHHIHLKHNGGWSFFVCPGCGKRAANLWLVGDAPRCVRCCNRVNIWHRSRMGLGRGERLKARDKHLDRMQAQLDTTTPLRFKPAPKHWRGKAQLVSNSRALTMRMRRSMIVCRLAMLASQQAANQGDDGLLRAYQPRADAAGAIDIKPIWRARTSEQLQAALDTVQSDLFAALSSNDPQQRLGAARIFLRSREARRRGW
jgi:hypothetical protein